VSSIIRDSQKRPDKILEVKKREEKEVQIGEDVQEVVE
jgi:hypothetical protein